MDISCLIVQKGKLGAQVDVPPTVPTHRRVTVSFMRSTAYEITTPSM